MLLIMIHRWRNLQLPVNFIEISPIFCIWIIFVLLYFRNVLNAVFWYSLNSWPSGFRVISPHSLFTQIFASATRYCSLVLTKRWWSSVLVITSMMASNLVGWQPLDQDQFWPLTHISYMRLTLQFKQSVHCVFWAQHQAKMELLRRRKLCHLFHCGNSQCLIIPAAHASSQRSSVSSFWKVIFSAVARK